MNNNNYTKNAVGLVRVSTDKQEYERQINAIAQYCTLEEYNLGRIFQEEPGTSGRNTAVRKGGFDALGHYNQLCKLHPPGTVVDPERPALSEAINAIRTWEEIDVLVIYALDRLSRDATELLLLQRIAEAHDVTLAVVSAGGALEASTASGWLQFAMQAILAEHECRQVAERTSASLRTKAEAGRRGARSGSHVGRPPVGWRKDPETGAFVHDENTWPIVEQVTDLRNKGCTYSQIAETTGVPRSSVRTYLSAYEFNKTTETT